MIWCFYIRFDKFHRSIIIQTLLMQEAIQKRKHQQWTHIQQQYKNYKKNFHGRPLIPKQVTTYLQMTNFIMTLVPAFNDHYFAAMTQEENSFVNQVMQSVSNDILNKLKSLAYRIQKKEIQENNSKDVKTLCKVCLHELRAAQIAEAKHSLQGKQALAQSILRMIKEVEETSQTFSFQEDRRFFNELKNALKKKEEIIQICQSEGTQFINMIEEQLKGIMLNKELLIFPEDKISMEPEMKGYELKQNVTKSLKRQLDEKIPEIIRMVSENLRKKQERQRKLKIMHTSVQTMDAQTSKILDFKRKIASLQQELTQANNQKTKISWSLQEKTVSIDRYQRQLKDLREQLNIKVYDLQKETRSLQEKNKKYREQLERYKSRRNLDMTENNLKSMSSFAQLKDPSFAQQTPEEPEQNQQRRQKKKKTVISLAKTNGKFYLPTIKKISNDEEIILQQDTIKHQPQQSFAQNNRQSRFNSNDVTMISSAKISISRQNSKQNIGSKQNNRSRKKGERLLTIANTKDSVNEGELIKKASYKSIKTQRGTQGNNPYNQMSQKDSLPSIKKGKDQIANLQKKSSNQIKRLNNSVKQKNGKIINNQFRENESNAQSKVSQRKHMKQQAFEINEKLKSKISERSSANSSPQNKSIYNAVTKTTKQSIYKEKIRTQEPTSISESFYQNYESQSISIKRHTEKPYLRNSFSKINEQIDKQNYQTPQFQPEQGGMEDLKKIQENKSIKHHLFKIYKELSKETKLNKEISIEKFSQIFERYVSELKTSKNENKSPQNDDNITMALTQPRLPKINQNIINSSLLNARQSQGYSSISRLKKYNQKHELQLLKSRLKQQVNRSKSKQHSFNASYHLSPSTTQEQYQLSRFGRQQSLVKNKNNTLLTFEAMLFFNEEIAYDYETHFSKKRSKTSVPLTPPIEQYLGELFNVFQEIKNTNMELYQSISGFLRYPFSHSQNGFLQIDIIKSLSLNTLTQCFLRLLVYHKACEGQQSVCSHLIDFKKKLQAFKSVKKS